MKSGILARAHLELTQEPWEITNEETKGCLLHTNTTFLNPAVYASYLGPQSAMRGLVCFLPSAVTVLTCRCGWVPHQLQSQLEDEWANRLAISTPLCAPHVVSEYARRPLPPYRAKLRSQDLSDSCTGLPAPCRR